jgi:hypothetical protein
VRDEAGHRPATVAVNVRHVRVALAIKNVHHVQVALATRGTHVPQRVFLATFA